MFLDGMMSQIGGRLKVGFRRKVAYSHAWRLDRVTRLDHKLQDPNFEGMESMQKKSPKKQIAEDLKHHFSGCCFFPSGSGQGISTQGALDALRRQLGPGVDPLYDQMAKRDDHKSLGFFKKWWAGCFFGQPKKSEGE